MVLLAHFNILVGQEYRLWVLLFGIYNTSIFDSSALTNVERKELSGDLDLLKNSSYSYEEGNILANFVPTETKCSLKILDMRDFIIILNILNSGYWFGLLFFVI